MQPVNPTIQYAVVKEQSLLTQPGNDAGFLSQICTDEVLTSIDAHKKLNRECVTYL